MYCSNPRGSLWASMTLVILFTLYDPTKDSRKTAVLRVVFEPPWWSSEKFYATVTSTNSHFVLFFSVPFYVPVCKSRVFLIPTNTSSSLIATEGGEETISKITLKSGPPRIFGLGNETLIEDPWILRWNPFELHFYEKDYNSKKENVQFCFVHYKCKFCSRRPFAKRTRLISNIYDRHIIRITDSPNQHTKH